MRVAGLHDIVRTSAPSSPSLSEIRRTPVDQLGGGDYLKDPYGLTRRPRKEPSSPSAIL